MVGARRGDPVDGAAPVSLRLSLAGPCPSPGTYGISWDHALSNWAWMSFMSRVIGSLVRSPGKSVTISVRPKDWLRR